MAEIAVQSAIEELNYFLRQKDFFLVDVDERVRFLRNKLKRIHALLNDVDGILREHEIVKPWVDRIIEVAHYTEDVIDDFIFKSAQQRGETSAGLMSYPPIFARGIKDIPAIQDVGKKIVDIERSLDEILSYGSQYGIDNIRARGEASTCSDQSQIQREKKAPIVEEVDVFGIEDATRALLGRVMGGGTRRDVISITGMGSATFSPVDKVYTNLHVWRRFDFRGWPFVPQASSAPEYPVSELLIKIISNFERLSGDEINRMREEDLRSKLSGYLEGKRYLVVINNINKCQREAWDGLITAFPDGENGSRVVLTTDNKDVAKYADAQITPNKIGSLNEYESCWALFCKKALLGNPAAACPQSLLELVGKMVAKCGGLPLAIAVLGGVLSRKEKTMNEWEIVLRKVEWWLNKSKDQISGILAFSYHDLPCFLKPCFLYFGAFPEDSEIYADELIRMWIAEGFVQRRGGEEMEDVAEDYLQELISRSMILVAKTKSNGMAKNCRVHDLLRDLAISKGKEERFLDVYGNIEPTSATKARRVAITCGDISKCSGDISKCISLNSSTPHLRSVVDFSYKESDLTEEILGGAFKFLRVMHLKSYDSSLPDEIGYLIHLRYLRLKMPKLKCLPSSITRLSNLQTLDIQNTSVKKMLPDDIWKMEQMRHLILRNHELSNGKQLHHLRNLQTLSIGQAGSWIEEGLEKLTNLRELGIEGDLKEALFRSISKLVHLRSLSLLANDKIPAFESLSKHEHLYKMKLVGHLGKLPEPHVFPPNLTKLHLRWSKIDRDPMGILEKLPNLRTLIEEFVYKGKEMVCSVGGFPLLDFLTIGSEELEEWRVEEGAMPNLRRLEIICPSLKKLPDGLRHLTTLQELQLKRMSKELKERATANEGEDWFKIRHIPSIIINELEILHFLKAALF